jgi:hypothetical protein
MCPVILYFFSTIHAVHVKAQWGDPPSLRLFVLIFVLIEQWQWSYIVIKPFHQSFGIWFSRPDIVSSSVMNEPSDATFARFQVILVVDDLLGSAVLARIINIFVYL